MEVAILPEMLEAGLEALAESKKRKRHPSNVVVAVYLAMRAVEAMYAMQQEKGTVH